MDKLQSVILLHGAQITFMGFVLDGELRVGRTPSLTAIEVVPEKNLVNLVFGREVLSLTRSAVALRYAREPRPEPTIKDPNERKSK